MTVASALTSFVDIFKKSFLDGSSSHITIEQIIAVMAVSLVMSAFIYIIYKKCYIGVIYSHNFNVAVSMMCVISAMIVATISSNITLSLGMVGALSIVRFRTAIKDPIDLIFLFWAVAAGIAIGARLWYMAVIGNIFVGLVFIVLTRFRQRVKTYLMVVNYADSADDSVTEALIGSKHVLRSRISNGGSTELTVELKVKKDDISVADDVKAVEGVNSVSLIAYNGDFAQ